MVKQYIVARSGNIQNKYTVCTVYPYINENARVYLSKKD